MRARTLGKWLRRIATAFVGPDLVRRRPVAILLRVAGKPGPDDGVASGRHSQQPVEAAQGVFHPDRSEQHQGADEVGPGRGKLEGDAAAEAVADDGDGRGQPACLDD